MSETYEQIVNKDKNENKKKRASKPYAIVADPGSSLANKTGSWRTLCPQYVHRIPPCNVTCPAGENIQQWLSYAQEGKIREAWDEMVKNNPFPAVMGRACYHTCEKACNRAQFDGAVHINLIERSIGDIALRNGWQFDAPDSDIAGSKKILIVGAGPSGLSAAYFLRKFGHDVTVYESQIKPGGMMRYGVPSFRLAREVLDTEIKRIVNTGINLVCSHRVEHIKDEMANFDAIYVSTGAFMAAKIDMKVIGNSCTLIDAVDLFRKMENGESLPNLGEKVVIYGGGNTAIDAARTALRLGSKSVKIVYRKAISNMPAHKEEVEEALQEGVEILCLSCIQKVDGNNIVIDKMTYDEANDILACSGETDTLEADSVIFAIGQSVDAGILDGIDGVVVSPKGVIEVDKNMMTGKAGIFAGGDVIAGKRTITNAIGCGKKAAKCIDAYLHGIEIKPNIKPEVAHFKRLNTVYYGKTERSEIQKSSSLSFNEENISFSEEKIIAEAERCFSCGNCFHCDNCYGFCPDGAIHKAPDGTLEIDYEYCKGCGICASECPCGAIKMG